MTPELKAKPSKHIVIVGPLRSALRYARRRGWNPQDVIVATDATALHAIDPPTITKIIVLGRRVTSRIWHEIEGLRSLWQVRVVPVTA